MSRTRVVGTILADNVLLRKNRIGCMTIATTLTALTLGDNSPDLIEIQGEVALTLALPTYVGNRGRRLTVLNSSTFAAGIITVQSSTGGGVGIDFGTTSKVNQSMVKSYWCNGAGWYPENVSST